MSEYKAVTAEELKARLGMQCSPMAGKNGYVIGPDIIGRVCHIGTYCSMAEAQAAAKRMNGE